MEENWRRSRDWFWEGNLQERMLDYMQNDEGLTILSPGQPTAQEIGIEIVAEKLVGEVPVHHLVTVRGWPSGAYTKGRLAGQPRLARPDTIAREWMGQVVLDLALGRGADPEVSLSLALPTMAGYIRYLQRLRWFLAAARISVYLVAQDGRVTMMSPGAAPASALSPQGPPPGTGTGTGTRRKLGLPGSSRLQLPLLHVLIDSGGRASRTECIALVAQWFPEVPQPPPAEFGQRLSIAQNTTQLEGFTEIVERGVWAITEAGRAVHDAEWEDWLKNKEA
ncbi:MAG TPA: hypothetical protein VND68_00215 [Chloroflexia bacterium]|jgi:hypothetical protein|nr:hypothetical protein [Chloroflexia bacterium]